MENNIVTNEMTGKVAIVTGAASGIGHAIAKLLYQRGCKVLAEDYNEDVTQLEEDFPGIITLVADVTDEKSASLAVNLAVEYFGKLDLLVNNAGRIINKLVVDTTLEDWDLIMATNVTGAFLHTREAMKAMIPNKSGAIVNIASYASFFVFPTISAYAASKGALAQLTRVAAAEGIEHGIRVNAIGVGDVVTNLINEQRTDGREFLADHGKAAPIKRAADPSEIAEIVSFLASDRASFMVGSVVMADGGISMVIQ
ncbi:NAD(P)-dependent dehydrogenase, short-chain alcohol dehydrogenase family [Pedobacter westerhofensis]|uniref:NAD(P)-dependent dehydrogenase, short-chain alcohol dehydrogenase family n=1 Tax=Pedobacter westerhofensis TaxID=425512 RepID=A0A521ATY9_9SPHI|nr:SDR family oxidoreductase [Pedobacter westerhofensis]SMO38080.1 NAD(P)-dependent dehydrogenase, short-chain alcohol dehydrogenase family [Pedobacter westerhofensis]